MNLFGWYNLNFSPGLLSGKDTKNNEYIDQLTMRLHDYLETTSYFGSS
jgi:hypothetical protein